MAISGPSQKDLQTISDAVLNGTLDVNNVPTGAQLALSDYWQQNGVDLNSPNQDLTAAQLDSLRQQRQAAEGGITNSPLFKPIEWVGSKLYAAYSATVSPALSAGFMAAHSVVYGRPDYIGQDGEIDALKDYWNVAHNISPGQAIWELGISNKGLEKRGIRPDQMAADMKLYKEGKYQDEATPGDPFGNTPRSVEYFNSGASKYVTGTADLAVSWYLDPLVLGGKAAGATKALAFTKPIAKSVQEPGAISRVTNAAIGRTPTTSAQKWDQFFQKPAFQKMVDTVMQVKTSTPETAALRLRRDLPTLSRSANGDTLSRLLAQAKDADEVSDVLRISMGDDVARDTLGVRNAKLTSQVNIASSKQTILGDYFNGMTSAQQASAHGQKVKSLLDDATKSISDMNAQSRIIDDKLEAFRSIENMNFNRVTTPLGMKIKGSGILQDPAWQKVKGQGVIKATGALVHNTAVGFPVAVIRSYSDLRPTYYIDIHGEGSHKALDAVLRETKTVDRTAREKYVSDYLAAPTEQKALYLTKIEQEITHRSIDKYNAANPNNPLTYDLADTLYKELAAKRRNGQAAAAANGQRSYSGATMPDPNNPGLSVRVDEISPDGTRLVSTPIFDTQLANSHVMLDFNLFDRAINAHGSDWQKMMNQARAAGRTGLDVADTIGSVWKFAQLFRLGYAPRALADDFLGQVARFGGSAMFMRAAQGSRDLMTDFVHGRFATNNAKTVKAMAVNEAQKLKELIATKGDAQSGLVAQLNRLKATNAHPADIQKVEDDLADITAEIYTSRAAHANFSKLADSGQGMRDVQAGREVFEGGFNGQQGALFNDLNSGDRNLQNLMGSSGDWYLKKVRRLNWENISPSTHGSDVHMEAWMDHLNKQIGQSAVGREILKGRDEASLADWMKNTPEGKAYRKDIGLTNMSDRELAQRTIAHVDHVIPPVLTGSDDIRKAVLDGNLSKEMLEQMPVTGRPMINSEQWKYATGESAVATLMDKSMNAYYKAFNQIPARKLLRNPLFGQAYKAHLHDSMQIMKSQGVTHITEDTRKVLELNARKAAVRTVNRYTFTMDAETRMAYMMRHFGAFFGAQQESWNRWARIISDKPQTLFHVAQVYGAPSRAGLTVDQDGNPIDAYGYSTNPDTGERKLVDYADRKMVIQIPEELGGDKLNKFLGLDPKASLTIPLSTAEIVLNHGDGAMPIGAGPLVQVPVNHFAKNDPKVADWAQKMGVLPFGPQQSILDFVNPTTGKRLGDSNDEMGETRQRALFYMMQSEMYKFDHGLRDTAPTWKELDDRANRWTIFRTAAAFALPFSVNGQDPYQYFRDEYQRYQKLDPNSADEKFYDKYGESFYQFSQSMSKNNTGLRPTAESVKMSKHYQDLIDSVGPEYAGVIVGDEGDGNYSNGAYFYQKTHAAGSGSATTQRSNMSAREAWDASKVALGWQQYNSVINGINAQLFDAGYKTYDDKGAEDFKLQRQAMVKTLGSPTMPDGTANPYYNEAWSKAFNTMDKNKYDRTAADLSKIVSDPEIMTKSQGPDGTVGIRSDLYTLKTYLQQRSIMQIQLNARDASGGSADINAQSNYDLKNAWAAFTMDRIEKDTKFAWLHNRYFANDMGFGLDTYYTPTEQEKMAQENASLAGTIDSTPTMFDILQQGGDQSLDNTSTQ